MKLFKKKINSDRLFRWLFHFLFWGLLIGWPLLSSLGNEEYNRFAIRFMPITLTHIPLFFLNTAVLVPNVLRRQGVGPYLLSLLALVVVFVVLQVYLRVFIDPHFHIKQRSFFFTSVYVLMVTGIATGYALITDLVDQEKARQEERQERLQSELSFLRSQISPHFIFNVLNSIVYLIRAKSPLAETVTIKLSELMRYMLYQSNDAQVPLEKELGYLKNYVELQKIRFEEDVDIRLEIKGEAAPQLIEPMLMIPFVENAFKHGVGLITDPIIDMRLLLSEEELEFTVRNKIGPETAEDKDPSTGIGLRNVKRRLELLYPETHQLETGVQDNWFVARLHLRFSHEPSWSQVGQKV